MCAVQADSRPLLTVAVAAYNGQATLADALSSCLAQRRDQLEVIVVDDGSTDGTARIARQFAGQYPGVFRLLRQPNSGYGAAVTAALGAAQGRYFRTLDCDDWFDPNALDSLLEYLADADADAVLTGYCTVQGSRVLRRFDVAAGRPLRRTLTFDQLGAAPPDLEIHALTFRTRVLRDSGLQLPGHCSYTDMAYTFYGMAACQTLAFCPCMLYHYRLGRNGQSVSMEHYRRHFQEYAAVVKLVLDAADRLGDDAKGRLLCARARDIAQYGIELLLRFPTQEATALQLAEYDRALRRQHPRIAARMTNKNTRLLRATAYRAYPVLSWWARRKRAAT